jgi:uncharacterized iron-regulated protein
VKIKPTRLAHFLQAEFFRKIRETFGEKRSVALSLEMFEREAKMILDEYLGDLTTEKKFLDDSRKHGNLGDFVILTRAKISRSLRTINLESV